MAHFERPSAAAAASPINTSGPLPPDVSPCDADSVLPESSRIRKPRLSLTRELKNPTEYVQLMNGKFAAWAFNEERGPLLKGEWRKEAFKQHEAYPVDLEIGTGNGYHFAHLVKKNPERGTIGVEIKFKPLIQSIKRALLVANKNACIVRYDASRLADLFAAGELNNVYIHHPDPWPRKRSWKHRLIQAEFLDTLYDLQRSDSIFDFKTDSEDYYEWAIERFRMSRYKIVRETRDLHQSDWKDENFVTHFESIFLKKGQPIFYARMVRA